MFSSCFSCPKGEISMSNIKSWKSEADEDAQSEGVKSVDSIPGVQDPLGSSVMTPDDT